MGKNKSFIVLLMILGLMLTSVVGCSKGATDTGSNTSGELKKYELKLAHSSPATVEDKLEYSAQEFKKDVEAASNGRITVTTFPASQLGSDREVLEGTQLGTIEMGMNATAALANIYKDIGIFDLPYLFSSYDVAYKVLDGPVGQEMTKDIEAKTGLHILGYGENGFRSFTNNVRPIAKPDDVKGLKIRVMESPLYLDLIKALGGSPTPMAFAEVYTALSQGAIDGQENPLGTSWSSKFQEVQKYVSVDNHVYSVELLSMNGKLYNSMDPEAKKIIDDASKKWLTNVRTKQQQQSADALNQFKAYGTQVNELTLEQTNLFREATKTVYDNYAKQNFDNAVLAKVLQAVTDAEASLKK